MPRDPDRTHSRISEPHTHTFDPTLDRGLAAAFGADHTPGGWSQPPLLRDDPSEHSPIVQTTSPEMPRGTDERYQLLGEIARGGMGVILKGRDPDLGRDLAFKVLRAELAGKAGAVQRFVEEAQVGGQLQHPGIIPIYDLGRFADGRPFFAMKLVKGRTLADLLAERPTSGGFGSSRGRFLVVFQQICQTLGYAHSKGVIHRDLKPANVMVGGFGEVLVMDWGLAKVLPRGGIADELKAQASGRCKPADPPTDEPTEIKTARLGTGSETAAGSVMGTPSYMPPEQAGGELEKVDERADVFGLGAILCVILTGDPPYRGDSAETVRLMAVRGQLTDAFARLDSCGADDELVALCKRSLSPEREGRPRDAGELAAAVGAYLAGVEQRAHDAELERAEAAAEAREQRKRRKVQAALGLTFTALVALGGAFAWWQDRQATARRVEVANRERDDQNRRDRNAEAITALVGQCEDALRADDTAKAAVALEAAEKRAVEGGAGELQDRLARCRADLAILRDLDDIDRFRWIAAEGKYPDGPAMAERYRAALGRFGLDPAAAPADEVARRVAVSAVRDRLVEAFDNWLRGERSESVRTVLRTADPDPFRDEVRDAGLARDRDRLAELAGRPEALNQPPGFAAALGDNTAAPVDLRRAILEAAIRRRPNDVRLLITMGRTYRINQRFGAEERVRWFQAAAGAAPWNPAAHDGLGIALKDKGDTAGAIAAFREAVRLAPDVVTSHNNLGAALSQAGKYAEAIAAFRKAISLDPTSAWPHTNLGVSLFDRDNPDEAIFHFREAIKYDPKHALAHYRLGVALRRLNDPEGAIACFRAAVQADPTFVPAHFELGLALKNQSDLDEAIVAYRTAVLLAPTRSFILNNLGQLLANKGDTDTAILYYQLALKHDPRLANAYYNMGRALRTKQDHGGAIAALRKAVEYAPAFGTAYNQLGLALRDAKQLDEAIAVFREANANVPWYGPAYYNLGNALTTKRDFDGAIAAYRKAVECDPTHPQSHFSLGNLIRAKDLDGAIAAYRKAVEYDPHYAAAYSNLANALRLKGDTDGMIAAYRKVVELTPAAASAHNNLGMALSQRKEFAEALIHFREASRLVPNDNRYRTSLGYSLLDNGDMYEASAIFREAIGRDPKLVQAHSGLAIALHFMGDVEGDAAACREAIRLDPKHAQSLNSLAWIMATHPEAKYRNGKEAVELATRACEATGWKNAHFLDTLAATYAEAGDFDKAIEFQKKALVQTRC